MPAQRCPQHGQTVQARRVHDLEEKWDLRNAFVYQTFGNSLRGEQRADSSLRADLGTLVGLSLSH